MTTSIYAIQSAQGPVKIGIAADVGRRLSHLRTSSPAHLHLAFVAASDRDLRPVEQMAHTALIQRRLAGEWFNITIEDAVKAIEDSATRLGINLTTVPVPERKAASMEPKNDLHRLRIGVMTTQAVMAKHMGIPIRTYEDLENGKSPLRPIHLNAARWACVTIRAEGLNGTMDLPADVLEPIKDALVLRKLTDAEVE